MARPLRLATLGFVLATGLAMAAPPTAAQAVIPGTLQLGEPAVAGHVAVAPGTTELLVPWRLAYGDAAQAAAAAADGTLIINWWILCPTGPPFVVAPSLTPVPYQPGESQFSGTAALTVQASADAVGMEPQACVLHASALGRTAQETFAEFPVTLTVEFLGDVRHELLDARKSTGPQKMVSFAIALENLGNARTEVRFELLDAPGGKWNSLLPEVIVLEPPTGSVEGVAATAYFTVATPFHNGYNSDSGTFVVRLLPAAANDPSQTLPPREVEVHATSKGWYVPGPGPAILLGLLGLAAVAARRRA